MHFEILTPIIQLTLNNPDIVESKIDRYAFSGCDSLKKVIIRDIKPLTIDNN